MHHAPNLPEKSAFAEDSMIIDENSMNAAANDPAISQFLDEIVVLKPDSDQVKPDEQKVEDNSRRSTIKFADLISDPNVSDTPKDDSSTAQNEEPQFKSSWMRASQASLKQVPQIEEDKEAYYARIEAENAPKDLSKSFKSAWSLNSSANTSNKAPERQESRSQWGFGNISQYPQPQVINPVVNT